MLSGARIANTVMLLLMEFHFANASKILLVQIGSVLTENAKKVGEVK